VFVLEGSNRVEPIPSMPGVERQSLDRLLKTAEQGAALGIPALALVPGGRQRLQDAGRRRGMEPRWSGAAGGRALKKEFPELGVVTDVALDPYTSHGQDGLIDPAIRAATC
jgi:porphobilinogen synthase